MKNKLTLSIRLLLLSAFVLTATQAFAYYGSSGDTYDCPDIHNQGTSCVTFHGEGYTGGTGEPGTDFPNGLNFASFNGYIDQTTEDGRPFKEGQFLYIESLNVAQSTNAVIPYPSPWDNPSDYNFSQGTSVNINFVNGQPQRVGFWGYMHNNGTANQYPAYDTSINIDRWGSWTNPSPATIFRPRLHITSTNTKPRQVFAAVTVTGSEPFVLVPKEFYAVREKDMWRNGVDYLSLNSTDQIRNVTTTGFKMSSNPTYAPAGQMGKFDSSQVHYVIVYFEFEAVPQEQPKECADLKTNPGSAGLAVAELNKSTPVVIDTLIDTNGAPYMLENGGYSTIRYCYNQQQNINYSPAQYTTTNGCAEAPSNVQISFTATKVGMLTIQVVGADSSCTDYVKTKETPVEKECAELVTDPGRTNQTQLEVGDTFPIDVESLVDTEGNDYRDADGNVPTLLYCYSGDIVYEGNYQPWFDIMGLRRLTPELEITGDENPRQLLGKIMLNANPIAVFDTQVSDKCILASADQVITVTPLEDGTMTITTMGVTDACNEEFDVGQPEEGQCEDLTINQTRFSENRTSYSVDVQTNPSDLDYNVEWSVERDNDTIFTEEITNSDEIDLSDYSGDYSFEPGDTLIAKATSIEDPNNRCVDSLGSEERDCEDFNLDKDEFIRDDQEICFETDWPVTELEYETSEGDTGTLDVDDNCFILNREVIEESTWIDLWVPGFEDACRDRLTYKVEPPDFDKNVRDEGGTRFVDRAVSNFTDDYVDYELKYTHYNDGVQDVTITDTIGIDGRILGYVGNQESGGYIDYQVGSMMITLNGNEIYECQDPDNPTDEELRCYVGDIGNPRGVMIQNVPNNQEVRIQYRGLIHSEVNVENCSARDGIFNTSGICGETYTNVSTFDDEFTRGSKQSEVMIPCPYIIIRAGGDVVLENPLDYGVDTLACADIANADVPVIIPGKPTPGKTPATGPGSTPSPTFTPAICKNQPTTGGETGYEDIAGISSLICEVQLKTSEALQQRAIVLNIDANKQKVARYEQNLNDKQQINNATELPATVNGVYYKNNGSLTLGDGIADLTFTKGAKTIIVENGDIKINSNIVYEDDESALQDPRNIASLTLIVINGNIIIGPEVEQTAGVFFAQEGDTAGTGQLCQETCSDHDNYSETQFIHYGSIYGDINNLLKYRAYTGDPTKEEGAVVIRFDNRIYLNPSVVLQEILPASEFVLS